MDRITKAYQNALHIKLCDTDKIAMLSDCHRGDGGLADNFLKNRNIYFAALTRYLNEGYTYIELGDGDELWENDCFCDIDRAYGDVFWLIERFYSQERFYMLYGNHDMVKRRGLKLKYFNEQKNDVCTLPVTTAQAICFDYRGKELLLLHGHQADFFNDRLWRVSRLLVRYMWKPLELIGVTNPVSAAYNPKKQSSVEYKLSGWAEKNQKLLIAGHTHRAAFSKPGEGMYFNDGSCVNPSGINAVEIESGRIQPVKWRIKTRSDGTLFVGKVIMQNPVPILDYFKTGENK